MMQIPSAKRCSEQKLSPARAVKLLELRLRLESWSPTQSGLFVLPRQLERFPSRMEQADRSQAARYELRPLRKREEIVPPRCTHRAPPLDFGPPPHHTGLCGKWRILRVQSRKSAKEAAWGCSFFDSQSYF